MPNTPHSSRRRSALGSRSASSHGLEVLWPFVHRYRAPLRLGLRHGRQFRSAGRVRYLAHPDLPASAFFSLFKMVLSGSSGNIDINHCPVFCRTTFDLALRTQSGWLRSGTSQAKNRKATTTMISPRASPKRKPSVRSSAPTRLSSTMSEMRAVMIETIKQRGEEYAAGRNGRGHHIAVEVLLRHRQNAPDRNKA